MMALGSKLETGLKCEKGLEIAKWCSFEPLKNRYSVYASPLELASFLLHVFAYFLRWWW